MFTPKYTIGNKLLANTRKVYELISGLNGRKFPKVILAELEKRANEVSSHASTSIEGNPLPLTEVKKILKSKPAYIRNSEKEVLNYNKALVGLNKSLKSEKIEISLKLVLKIHKQVVEGLLPDYDIGRLRQRPVVVNNPATGKTVFIPPDVKDVAPMIKDLIDFINQNLNKIDPLILSGLLHKQMVLIHPFMDGNGRTTRLATKVILAKMGLDTFNLFSFENYYNNNVSLYFKNVGEFGDYYELKDKIDFTAWLEYFTDGIVDELLRVGTILLKQPIPQTLILESHDKKILDYISKNGYIRDRDYAKLTDRARPTRALDFRKLVKSGLIKRTGRGRATVYILREDN